MAGSAKDTQVMAAAAALVLAAAAHDHDPEAASRPWDRDRDGFVLGDGAGVVVLEEYELAKARGARIYAELCGFGMSSDAYHMTLPPEDGRGALQAMQQAVQDAQVDPAVIGYINAHGTSTRAGDLAESRAVRNLMGSAANDVAVSSTKSMIGHLLGAAGAVEAIFTVLALRDQVAPPTINLDNPAEIQATEDAEARRTIVETGIAEARELESAGRGLEQRRVQSVTVMFASKPIHLSGYSMPSDGGVVRLVQDPG